MQRALGEYQVAGIKTNLSFFRSILAHEQFLAGELSTGFIDKYYVPGAQPERGALSDVAAIAAALHASLERKSIAQDKLPTAPGSGLGVERGSTEGKAHASARRMANSPLIKKCQFETLIDRQWVALSLEGSTVEGFVARLPDRELKVDAIILNESSYSLLIDGNSFDVTVHRLLNHYQVTVNGVSFEVALRDPRQLRHQTGADEDSAGPASVTSPMPGKLVKLLVAEGDSVKEGQGVAVVEAMKMQNELKASKSGTVEKLCVVEGQAVNAGECLLTIL